MKLKYSEIFYSMQGEGYHVGVPSVFLRTFACNFECRGFGQSEPYLPEEFMPHNKFDISEIDNIEDLPIFNVGCDSSASWSKKYAHLAPLEEVSLVAKRLSSSMPVGDEWTKRDSCKLIHLVVTGGEPLLKGNQKKFIELLKQPELKLLRNITFETNGTQIITPELSAYLRRKPNLTVTWSISPKLSISGEYWKDAINPDAVLSIQEACKDKDIIYLKFVVREKSNILEVHAALQEYENVGVDTNLVYLMPEGATQEGLSITEHEVAEMALKCGLRFSPRLHVNVFGNKWGT